MPAENTPSQRSRMGPAKESAAGARCVLVIHSSERRGRELVKWLHSDGCRTFLCHDGEEAISLARSRAIDLVLLDVQLQNPHWANVCRELRESRRMVLPVLLLMESTQMDWERAAQALAVDDSESVNDFLGRPFTREHLLAKVHTLLKVSMLHHELRISNSMLKELTQYLDNMVEAKVSELENVNRLRRFFSPQIVEAIVSEDAEETLKEHRGEITVVFLDLRNFTPFAENHTAQQVIHLVRDFHEAVGPTIFRYGGTLERFTGDGMMVFLGDPKPMPDHAYQAVQMALHLQYMIGTKRTEWAKAGYEFGVGIGIATGEAIMGSIGFERRLDYAAIGTVTNLASRLCSSADVGEVLIAGSTHEQIANRVRAESRGNMRFKGFSKACPVFSVQGMSGGQAVNG
jgi:adenylate cyclase